jgi:hypothetical protein
MEIHPATQGNGVSFLAMARIDEPSLESRKEAYKRLRADYIRSQLNSEKVAAKTRQLQKITQMVHTIPREQGAEARRAVL